MSIKMKTLFNSEDLSYYLNSRASKVRYAISMLDIEQASAIIDDTDLYEEFIEDYNIIVPELLEEKLQYTSSSITMEDSSRFDYPISDKTRLDRINVIRHTIKIPFEGDLNLFLFRPSTLGFEFTPPSGLIKDNMLILQFDERAPDKESIDREIKNTLYKIDKFLKLIEKDIDDFNKNLFYGSQKYIKERYEELRLNSGSPDDLISGVNEDTGLGRRRSRGGRGLDL